MSIQDFAEGPRNAVATAIGNIRHKLLQQMANAKEATLIDHYRVEHEKYEFNKLSATDMDLLDPEVLRNIKLTLKENAHQATIADDQIGRALTNRSLYHLSKDDAAA
jgi:hypothetical protein